MCIIQILNARLCFLLTISTSAGYAGIAEGLFDIWIK